MKCPYFKMLHIIFTAANIKSGLNHSAVTCCEKMNEEEDIFQNE